MAVNVGEFVNYAIATNSNIVALCAKTSAFVNAMGEVSTSIGGTFDTSMTKCSAKCYSSTTYTVEITDNSLLASTNCINDPSNAHCCATLGNVVGFQL